MREQDCEQLTLFPADFLANRSVWLESKKANGMNATFGLKCCELSENLRRVGSSVRTYLESCELPPGTWCRIWSAKVMTSRCLILKLRLSERCTDVKEWHLWPTPDTWGGNDGTKTRKALKGRHALSLNHAVVLWPTPTQMDYKDGTAQSCRNVPENGLLGRAVHNRTLYPTPRAQSATGKSDPPNRQGGADLQSVVGGQLNPTWVEWLMGYPLGWTDLNASETQ